MHLPRRKPGLKVGNLLAIAIAAAAWTGCGPPAPELTVSAGQLIAEYQANQVRADLTYKGRRVRITGTVASVGIETLGRPFLMLGDGSGGPKFVFAKEYARRIATINVGDPVTVTCTLGGEPGSIQGDSCRFQ